jgi:2-polyprenyl-3-methyl-5-hydroxy-6-metoxy-1,4-benzoquinol methylase
MHSKRIIEKVKEDYDQIAISFSETRKNSWPEWEQFKAHLPERARILDMGCGNGRLLSFLMSQNFDSYLGVDQSEALIQEARKHWNSLERVHFEVEMSHWKSQKNLKFTALFAIASFHHLPPDHQAQTLKNWASSMEKGGILFMSNWNLFQPRFWALWIRQHLLRTPSPLNSSSLLIPWKKGQSETVWRYYYAFSSRQLRKLLTKAGFTILQENVGKNYLTIARYEGL